MAHFCELISAPVLVTGSGGQLYMCTCARQQTKAGSKMQTSGLLPFSTAATCQLLKFSAMMQKNPNSPQNQNLEGFTLEDRPKMQASAGKAAAAAENWLMEAVKFYFALKIVAWTFLSCPTGLS